MLEALAGCSALALFTWKAEVLSPKASVAAFLIGTLVWVTNGPAWILLLASFLVIGYTGTKWKYDYKREMGVEEAKGGARGLKNILGNGAAPLIFAVFLNPAAFAGSISTALSDTLASEIGVFSKRARLITTWEKAEPGTNGAVSPLGTFFSIVGASIIAALGYFLLQVNPLIIFLCGFIGCQIDSVLGATLERRGILTNSGVNLLSTFSGGILAFVLVAL